MQHKAIAGGFAQPGSGLGRAAGQSTRRTARHADQTRLPPAVGWLIGLGVSLALWAAIIGAVAAILSD